MSLFKISGILETISTISLFFVAMPLKYIGGNEILVKIIGPIHGFLFILYCALVWWEQHKGRMPSNLAIYGMLAAIPPGGIAASIPLIARLEGILPLCCSHQTSAQ